MNIIYEVFNTDLPRLGPGDNNFTKKAFSYLTDLPSNPSILDVGCGGLGSYRFFENECLIGVDVSRNALKIAKDRIKGYIEFSGKKIEYGLVRAVANNLPLKDESFDQTSMIETLSLTGRDDYKNILGEISRVTKGSFIFTVIHRELDSVISQKPVNGIEKVTFTKEEIKWDAEIG